MSVFLKGAPEVVVGGCAYFMSHNNDAGFDEEEKEQVFKIVDDMAAEPLQVVAFALAELDLSEWEQLVQSAQDAETGFDEALADGKFEFTFVGLVGMVDNVRPSVPLVVRASKESGSLNVRMVTGDHVNTAKKVAKDCRILTSLDRNNDFAVMTGEQFRA